MKDRNKRQPIKIIKNSEIAKFFSMSEAITSMEVAFSSISSGDCYVPKRYIATTKDNYLTILFKPSFVNNQDKSCVKVLTQKNINSIQDVPTILGLVLLFDNVTGEILSIMDGSYITALRTGAASGMATKYLSREDSRNLAIFGCGEQGRTQLIAINDVRELEKIWVFDNLPQQAEKFVEEMRCKTKANIEIANDLDVLNDVDIICTATNSEKPLFCKSNLRSGTHINAIGSFQPKMQEIDHKIIRSSRVYFDDQEACMNESGDLLNVFKDHSLPNDNIIGEIGDYLLNKITGRTSDEEITLFKSVGTAIQDFIVVDRIYDRSLIEKFGMDIKLYE